MIVLLSLGSNANVSNACIEQNPVRPQELSAQGRKLEVAIRAGAAAMLGLKEFECMGWISWRWRLWIHGENFSLALPKLCTSHPTPCPILAEN